jgi:hypothetical protein
MMADNKVVQSGPVLDQYIHCKVCIAETGTEPYKQDIEVGFLFGTVDKYIAVLCKRHDMPITRIKIDVQNIPPHKSCGCGCAKEESKNE